MATGLTSPIMLTNGVDLRSRIFRTVFCVANGWTLLGALVQAFTMDSSTTLGHRLHIAGSVCLAISAAIYSLALPLWYVTRKR